MDNQECRPGKCPDLFSLQPQGSSRCFTSILGIQDAPETGRGARFALRNKQQLSTFPLPVKPASGFQSLPENCGWRSTGPHQKSQGPQLLRPYFPTHALAQQGQDVPGLGFPSSVRPLPSNQISNSLCIRWAGPGTHREQGDSRVPAPHRTQRLPPCMAFTQVTEPACTSV